MVSWFRHLDLAARVLVVYSIILTGAVAAAVIIYA